MPRIDVRDGASSSTNEYKYDDSNNYVYTDGRHICFFWEDSKDEYPPCDAKHYRQFTTTNFDKFGYDGTRAET